MAAKTLTPREVDMIPKTPPTFLHLQTSHTNDQILLIAAKAGKRIVILSYIAEATTDDQLIKLYSGTNLSATDVIFSADEDDIKPVVFKNPKGLFVSEVGEQINVYYDAATPVENTVKYVYV